MRIWRSHPVLFATIVGALIGVGNALAIEIPALFGKPSKGALALLDPVSHFGSSAGGSDALQVARVLLIEVGANVLIYAVMFAMLGLLLIAVRRMIKSTRR